MPLAVQTLHGSYDYRLVALSVLISMLASYAALDLAGRVTAARGIAHNVWLIGGATAMGTGIWAMHYVGMLAFHLPVQVEYDWPTVLLSFLAAIISSAIALFVVSRKSMGISQSLVGSLFMGSGIAAMHYIGMAAMRLPAMCTYSPRLVVFSVVLAVAIALVAIWLAFSFRTHKTTGWDKVLSAVVMGAAVPAMHYTGMAAASFTPTGAPMGDLSHALPIFRVGTVGIVVVTFMILGISILTSLVDRRLSAQASELDSRERRSRQILETSFDAFIGMDSAGRIIDWNEQAENMFGWNRDQAMSKSFSAMILRKVDRTAYEKHIEQLLASSSATLLRRRFETEATRHDASVFPVEITISAMRREGELLFAAFVRDLSDQKQADEHLQRSMKELTDLRFALDQHSIVATTDDRGIITFVNDKFCSISQYQRQELFGKDHRIVNSGHHPPEFIKQLWSTIKAGKVWKGEIKNRAKDGAEYWVDTTIVPFIDLQGKINQYIAIRTDITPLKQAEEESRKAKEIAEAASQSKSDFLANMSHEIRTPMNGIIGISELLTQTTLDSEQRNYVEMVNSSAHSLLTVLNDILDFSKIESGKLDFSPTAIHLRKSLMHILKLFATQAGRKQIELTLLVADDVPEMIMADELRLRQVLNNLISNALKFTDTGDISVRVDRERSPANRVDLHFEVRDTGVGIPPEKLQLIFEPFSQADSSVTRKYGGTGLGLTISVRLVQMMGGHIWVDSNPGKGSTFHFIASFDMASAMPAPTEPPAPTILRDKKALIVDDNPTNRLILEKTLARWGIRTQSVESAAKGLELLTSSSARGTPFSLLIVDGQMPEMDGFNMVRCLRERPDFHALAIVMLTSAGVLGDGERCRELGIRGFLSKPVDSETLHEAILRAVDRPPVQSISVSPEALSHIPAGKSCRILLAEDNAINQVVAIRHLEKLGHSVQVAANGTEALELWEHNPFDLILMDVQMPKMGGYEVTAEIRKREASARKRTPIIAMTAHAMVGDREKCLAAGMNGYVSKPIQIEFLAAEIHKTLNESVQPPAAALSSEPSNRLNRSRLATLMDGDLDLLAASVDISRIEFPKMVAELHASVESFDARRLGRAAHALNGMLGGLAAESAAALAQELEEMGKTAQWKDAASRVSELEADIISFEKELTEFLDNTKVTNSFGALP